MAKLISPSQERAIEIITHYIWMVKNKSYYVSVNEEGVIAALLDVADQIANDKNEEVIQAKSRLTMDFVISNSSKFPILSKLFNWMPTLRYEIESYARMVLTGMIEQKYGKQEEDGKE